MATVTNTYSVSFTPSLDGYVGRTLVDQTLANIRSGAGNAKDSTQTFDVGELDASTTTNQFAALYRNVLLFDTSSIPSNATITSATLGLFYAGDRRDAIGTTTIEVVSCSPSSTSALNNGDYNTFGSTSFLSFSNASFSSPYVYNVGSLNASGIANITKAGVSKFGTVMGWDFNNNFTGVWSSGAFSYIAWNSRNATQGKPTLTVNYTVDFPTLSVNNISSLANVTTITTS